MGLRHPVVYVLCFVFSIGVVLRVLCWYLNKLCIHSPQITGELCI